MGWRGICNICKDNWDSLKERSLDAIEEGTDCAAFVSVHCRILTLMFMRYIRMVWVPQMFQSRHLAYRLFDLGFTRYDDS